MKNELNSKFMKNKYVKLKYSFTQWDELSNKSSYGPMLLLLVLNLNTEFKGQNRGTVTIVKDDINDIFDISKVTRNRWLKKLVDLGEISFDDSPTQKILTIKILKFDKLQCGKSGNIDVTNGNMGVTNGTTNGNMGVPSGDMGVPSSNMGVPSSNMGVTNGPPNDVVDSLLQASKKRRREEEKTIEEIDWLKKEKETEDNIAVIIKYYNSKGNGKGGGRITVRSKSTINNITDLIEDGITVEDLKHVIDYANYLRSIGYSAFNINMFGSNFEKYLSSSIPEKQEKPVDIMDKNRAIYEQTIIDCKNDKSIKKVWLEAIDVILNNDKLLKMNPLTVKNIISLQGRYDFGGYVSALTSKEMDFAGSLVEGYIKFSKTRNQEYL